jgi:hypothetical protein
MGCGDDGRGEGDGGEQWPCDCGERHHRRAMVAVVGRRSELEAKEIR